MNRIYILAIFLLLLSAVATFAEDENSLPSGQIDYNAGQEIVSDSNSAPVEIFDENIIADQNAAEEISPLNTGQDENISEIGIQSISFISPLEEEIVKGVYIIIVGINNFTALTSQWFNIDGVDFNGELNGSTITTDFNSEKFSDNNYDLHANVCNNDACYSSKVRIRIKNTEDAAEATSIEEIFDGNTGTEIIPEKETEKFSVRASNIPSIMKITGGGSQLIDSGTDELVLPSGVFDTEIILLDEGVNVRKIVFKKILIDSNKILAQVNSEIPLSTKSPKKWVEWTYLISVKPGTGFESAQIDLRVPEGKLFLYKCDDWDFTALECGGKWGKVKKENKEHELSIQIANSGTAFGFAKQSLDRKILRASKSKKSFNPHEVADFEFEIDEEEDKLNERIRVFLDGPDGREEIGGKLQWTEKAKFRLTLDGEKRLRPGSYKIVAQIEDDNEILEEEFAFSWGLLSLNTKKSIYKLGETAQMEIIALNSSGSPVCGAEISLDVASPGGNITSISTASGIIPALECGVYDANFLVLENGAHSISVKSKSDEIESTFDTNFLSEENFEFDIIRSTKSKIDPTQSNEIRVRIDISAQTFRGNATVKEIVPKEFLVSSDASVEQVGDTKVLTWNRDFSGKSAFVEYIYSVPLEWPVLYTLGEAQIAYEGKIFSEARPWFVAVDPQRSSAFHVTQNIDYTYSQPSPDDAASGDSFVGTSTQSIYGMHPVGPNILGGASQTTGTTTVGNYKGVTWVSPPLAAQTIPAGTWTFNANTRENNGSDNLRLRVSLMVWADANDNKRGNLKMFSGTSAELGTSIAKQTITMANAASMAIAEGDKIIVEIDFNSTTSTLANSRVDFNFNQLFYDGNIIPPNIITLKTGQYAAAFHVWRNEDYNISEPMPNDAVTGDTFAGTSTQKFFLMRHIAPMGGKIDGPYKRTGTTTVGNYKGVTWVSPPLAAQTIPAGTWTIRLWTKEASSSDNLRLRSSIFGWADSNDNKLGTVKPFIAHSAELTTTLAYTTISLTNSSPITLSKRDKIVAELDFNSTTSTLATSRVDFNWSTSLTTRRDGNVVAPVDINLYAAHNVPQITTPSADANSDIAINTDFLVKTNIACDGNFFDCGRSDVNLQWCLNASCSNWADANSSSGAIVLITGQNPAVITDFNSGDINSTISWVVRATAAGTYELRVKSKGSNTDSNNSSGTERTITISGGAADYSFTLLMPSSGCTQGQGSNDAGTSCDRGYFVPTDLSGNSDQNQIDPQGQSSTVYFFVYDNQSTSSSDLNITMDLNAALPSTLKLKASKIYAGYHGLCGGNPDNNCVEITTSARSIGKALYTTGSQDLNIFLWADFVNAAAGLYEDRNAASTGISPS